MMRMRYLALLALMSLAACGDDPRPMVKLLPGSSNHGATASVQEAPAEQATAAVQTQTVASKELLPPKDARYPGDESRPEWQEGVKVEGGEIVAYNDRDAEHTVGPRNQVDIHGLMRSAQN